MDAALGSVGVGEVALLHRQAAQIVSRHGTDLIQLADQEVGERLLRLGRGLVRRLMSALVRGLMSALVRRLMGGLMGALMRGLGCRLCRSGFRRRRHVREPAMLKLHELRHGGKLGLQVFESALILSSKLLHELVELSFVSIDLLFKQAGTVLQVPSDVTHLLAPRSMTLLQRPSGLAVSRKTKLRPAGPPLGKYPGCTGTASAGAQGSAY
jgi:hypothetical protein